MSLKTQRRELRILANQLIPFYIGSLLDAIGDFQNQRGVGVP
jgi:hypothetical protein